jgi:hypothetical protein
MNVFLLIFIYNYLYLNYIKKENITVFNKFYLLKKGYKVKISFYFKMYFIVTI